jgi:hypothetical protein
MLSIILGACGWLSGAFIFYSLHRWVFHSKKSSLAYKIIFHKWNPLKGLAKRSRRTHALHHKETFKHGQNISDHMNTFFPSWVKLIVAALSVIFYLTVGLEFVLGLVAYFLYYEIRHQRAHRVRHHMDHHYSDPHSNFSGMVPTIDKLFGTYT